MDWFSTPLPSQRFAEPSSREIAAAEAAWERRHELRDAALNDDDVLADVFGSWESDAAVLRIAREACRPDADAHAVLAKLRAAYTEAVDAWISRETGE